MNKLTLKQQKWLEIYLKTGNATEAAREAYNCNERSARQIGYENMTKLDISELFDAQGMTLLKLITEIIEGTNATKLIKANLIVQKENTHDITSKQLIEAAKELNGVYMEVPDFAARHKYLTTALRMRKMYPGQSTKSQDEEPAVIKWVLSPAPQPRTASL